MVYKPLLYLLFLVVRITYVPKSYVRISKNFFFENLQSEKNPVSAFRMHIFTLYLIRFYIYILHEIAKVKTKLRKSMVV